MQRNFTKARIRCGCGAEAELCVPVRLEVPESLQCSPGAPFNPTSSRSDVFCPACRHTLFRTASEMMACIEDELRRGYAEHARYGTVAVDCR